ncbi:MAG: CPBP family intramembrane metalloprotease [Acidobacteria bacterium]|nr:CPBP family intramembrane metalloprotease [Acidobacteriota bacterium]MBI3424305.1 CPBP family intramembrane metalloprotease [Acidobacteriota bacterium]
MLAVQLVQPAIALSNSLKRPGLDHILRGALLSLMLRVVFPVWNNTPMVNADLPTIIYLPVAWMGVAGTSLSYALLARTRIDLTRVFAALNIQRQFTAALCLYNIWTFVAALIFSFLFARRGVGGVTVGWGGNLSFAGATLAIIGAGIGILLWPILEWGIGYFGFKMFYAQRVEHAQSDRLSRLELSLLTILGALTVPALEELIFRGYVFNALLAYTGNTARAIFFTALMFASIHVVFGIGMVIYALILSFMLSALALFANNLYPAILMHSLVNFWGIVAMPILSQRKRGSQRD